MKQGLWISKLPSCFPIGELLNYYVLPITNVLPTEIVIPIISIRVVGIRNQYRETSEPLECVNLRAYSSKV